METLLNILDQAVGHLPWISTIVFGFAILVLVKRILDHRAARAQRDRFRNPTIMLVLGITYLLLVIMSLPLGDSVRGQLLSLLGIILSAAIALSSTTFLGNVMAGLMIRGVRSFRAGDFIRVGEYFGRVSSLGMLSTEIQTEERDLVTLPNLYLVTNPIRVLRPSGTIISTTVSLGYDIPREKIKQSLLEAITETGLADGFVEVMELGDFSATYRAAGLLDDVKHYLSSRARLRSLVMDCLHRARIEIVSPNFRNLRQYPVEQEFIPEVAACSAPEREDDSVPEDVVFDKADKAETLEKIKAEHDELSQRIATVQDECKKAQDPQEKLDLGKRLERLKNAQESVSKLITFREKEVAKEDDK